MRYNNERVGLAAPTPEAGNLRSRLQARRPTLHTMSQNASQTKAVREFVVALVGRPNVGKSTLFNRWVGGRKAIVHRTPGVTRDRIFGRGTWLGKSFAVSDVAGFPAEGPFRKELDKQVQRSIEEAGLVLLLVDAHTGVTAEDRALVQRLRKLQKPFALVVNKADDARREAEAQVYHALGVQPAFFVSAENGRNLVALLDFVLSTAAGVETTPPSPEISLAIVGRRNVGKSTLLNALLHEERAVTSPLPGTTRDAVESALLWHDHRFLLVDTAGLTMKSSFPDELDFYSELRAKRAVQQADVAWLVLDSAEGILRNDKKIAAHLHEIGKCILLVANKWDLARYRKSVMDEFSDYVRNELSFLRFAPVVFISALEGWNLNALFEKSLSILEQARFQLPTPELNRIIHDYTSSQTLPGRGTRSLKIYYATQVATSPPVFQLYVNDPSLVTGPFFAGIAAFIRHFHPFEGVPLRFTVRARRVIIKSKANA